MATAVALVAALLVVPAVPAPADGAVRYVSAVGSDTIAPDCRDALRPCGTVQHALLVAAAGDTILVAAGMYREAIATAVGTPVTVTVKGGWNATFESQNGTTTVDATGRSSAAGFGEVIRLVNPLDDITVDSMTLTGGHGNGGAFTLNRSKLTVTRTLMTGNRGGNGGAINNGGGIVTITDSEISGNTAADSGGGVANTGGGQLTVTRSLLFNNRVDAGRFDGGAILNIGTTTISASTLAGNAAREGGGIRNGGTLTVTDSFITDNTASLTGGGIMAVGGVIAITRTALVGNRAATQGGGYYAYGGSSHVLVNTTISRNSAVEGGGVWVQGTTVALRSSSVTTNTATSGGGLYHFGNYQLTNTLIAGNSATNGRNCYGTGGGITSNGHNLADTGGCGVGTQTGDIVGVDAQLGPLNAGVQTLTSVSPAINAGNPAAPGSGGNACPGDDQRGVARQNRCDIGAYELVDTVAPVVVGTPDRAPNAAGWYRDNVTITWSVSDPDPSAGPATTPPVTVASTEGRDVRYMSAPACDPAGNCAAGEFRLSLDRTPPTVSVAVTPAANTAGWYAAAATVTFTCADTLSGIADCPSPVTVTEDGAGQAVTGAATDRAGNTATASVTVNVDATAPAISATVSQQPNTAGWNNGDVTVTFTCTDGLSGVADCTSPVTLTDDGANQTVTGTVTDRAGNAASVTVEVSIDKTRPFITASRTVANAYGWNNTDVVVTYTCNDTGSGSVTCPAPNTVTTEGIGQSVSGTATDTAGNSATATVEDINIDRTAPDVTAAVAGTPSTSGWYTAAPTIRYTCTDTLSGIASCPADVDVVSPGAGQTVTRAGSDKAGNSTSRTISGLNVDLAAPTVTLVGLAATTYVLGQTPDLSCTTTDATSGVRTHAELNVVRGSGGVYTATCAGAVDVAGNAASPVSATYTVVATVSSLANLTTTYVAGSGSPNADGVIHDLGNKLRNAQFCLYVQKVQAETAGNHPTLTVQQAAELTYWARVLEPSC